MVLKKQKRAIQDRELELFSIFTAIGMLAVALWLETPEELLQGMVRIILSRDALITDYFEIGGYGAALLNGSLVLGLAITLIKLLRIPFTGLTMAALWINSGFALWGKNPVNMLPIILGTAVYAKVQHSKMNHYVYTALFGTCLAPFITEMVYLLPFSLWINISLAALLGVFIGFVLPPLAMHTASMHMGYNLFNVGFAAGILAFAIMCMLRLVGIEGEIVLLWKAERQSGIIAALYVYFLVAFVIGLWINKGKIGGLFQLMQHPGRAVADFVLMDGAGSALMNMALVGLAGTTYVVISGGDFSGPVTGALLTMFGFAGFGVHLRNYLPVLAGVCLSALCGQWQFTTPGIQLAALFAVGLSPIAGQFGVIAGLVAGILHVAIVMHTAQMYGGLNLYNNGFSAGWVAIVIVPAAESLIKHFKKNKTGLWGKSKRSNRRQRK